MTLTLSSLENIFTQGCKPKGSRGIGIEREHFVYDASTLRRLTYPQIRRVFKEFLKQDWSPVYEGEYIIGAKRDGSSLSIEPGGQFELSAKVHKNLHDAHAEMEEFESAFTKILRKLHFFKLDMGFEALWRQDDLTWMPKERYAIMRNYMPTKGHHGHDMMRRTCTLQMNLDYTSEKNMSSMMAVCQAIHPIAAGLFANSPFYEGKLSGYQSFRNHVWIDTDPDRCGLLSFVHEPGMSFLKYLNYLLRIPMYFIYRDGNYLNAAGRSFLDFMEGKLSDIYEGTPTLQDFYDHMTVAFPEVRLKTFIEARGIDAGPAAFASAALYTGLLYDDHAFEKVQTLTQPWSFDGIQKLYRDVPKDGLSPHKMEGVPLWEVAKQIYAISEEGLKNRGMGEEVFLEPLWNIIQKRQTQSDLLTQKYMRDQNAVSFLFPK